MSMEIKEVHNSQTGIQRQTDEKYLLRDEF